MADGYSLPEMLTLCTCGHDGFCHYTDITAGQPPLQMCDGSFFCFCRGFEPTSARDEGGESRG